LLHITLSNSFCLEIVKLFFLPTLKGLYLPAKPINFRKKYTPENKPLPITAAIRLKIKYSLKPEATKPSFEQNFAIIDEKKYPGSN
jgi:hypothetical protein